jgi:hypothetical protein
MFECRSFNGTVRGDLPRELSRIGCQTRTAAQSWWARLFRSVGPPRCGRRRWPPGRHLHSDSEVSDGGHNITEGRPGRRVPNDRIVRDDRRGDMRMFPGTNADGRLPVIRQAPIGVVDGCRVGNRWGSGRPFRPGRPSRCSRPSLRLTAGVGSRGC